jgi:hypothetical protein
MWQPLARAKKKSEESSLARSRPTLVSRETKIVPNVCTHKHLALY